MYQYTVRELKEFANMGWNVVICESEEQAKEVKEEIKQSGYKARCGCIRNKDKKMILFVLTDRPIKRVVV